MYANSLERYNSLPVLAFLFSMFVISFLHGGNQNPEDVIAEKAAIKRQNPHAEISLSEIVGKYEGKLVVAQAVTLTKDPNSPVIRDFGYQLLFASACTYDDLPLQQTIINAAVDGLGDKEESIAIFCARQLKSFREKDFSVDAKNTLLKQFNERIAKKSYNTRTKDIILLIGTANVQSAMEQLQIAINQVQGPLHPFKITSPQSHVIAFAALLAKARMGDEKALEHCIALVDSETDEDFKVSHLLNYIGYIRQPKAVDYIKRYLYSDKKQHFAGPDVIQKPYSQIASEYLGKIIVGFPTQKEVFDFYLKTTDADPVFRKEWPLFGDYYGYHCRQWLESHASIEIIR
jgi:hypothetical protein